MGCTKDCMKYSLFFFNFVVSLCGLALIIIGAYNISSASNHSDLISSENIHVQSSSTTIIVIGIIIFFIATLGCCGVIKENRCMLILFGILLISIFIIQLGIGIYALTHKVDFKNQVEKGLSKEFDKIKQDPQIRKLFETMERELECCGVRGFTDYSKIYLPQPGSCCEDKSDCKIIPNKFWEKGCSSALADFIGKSGQIVGGAAIALSIIEVLSAIFAFSLARKYR